MRHFISLFAVARLLGGCGGLGDLSVSLVSVMFRAAAALETTAVFTLRLSNESPSAMQFNGEVPAIYLNGLCLGKGLSDQTVAVPRLGTTTHEVTVYLSNLALATRLKAIIEAKAFDYRLRSTFYGKSLLSRMQSESTGKLDLRDFTPSLETTNPPAPASAP
jgi:LEA14-like dessication related protein